MTIPFDQDPPPTSLFEAAQRGMMMEPAFDPSSPHIVEAPPPTAQKLAQELADNFGCLTDAQIDLERAKEEVERCMRVDGLMRSEITANVTLFEGKAFIVETSNGKRIVTATRVDEDPDAGYDSSVKIQVLDVGEEV